VGVGGVSVFWIFRCFGYFGVLDISVFWIFRCFGYFGVLGFGVLGGCGLWTVAGLRVSIILFLTA
jgi:hypothetical protein